MTEWAEKRIDKAFQMLVRAAVAGERCPMTDPHGPLQSGAIEKLTSLGMIRSEVSGRNYRRVVILKGEHAGKSTASNPYGHALWCIDGRHVERGRADTLPRQQPSAPRLLTDSTNSGAHSTEPVRAQRFGTTPSE